MGGARVAGWGPPPASTGARVGPGPSDNTRLWDSRVLREGWHFPTARILWGMGTRVTCGHVFNKRYYTTGLESNTPTLAFRRLLLLYQLYPWSLARTQHARQDRRRTCQTQTVTNSHKQNVKTTYGFGQTSSPTCVPSYPPSPSSLHTRSSGMP
jgi:hypothetical protein